MAPNDDASLIEETHKERNEAIFDYYSDLQECYSEVEESETMKRRKLRSVACAAMSTVADGVEIGKSGVKSGHHRRLWVKDRSKAWWDECNQPDFPKSEFKLSYQIRSMTQPVCPSLTPSFLLPPFSPLHEPTKPPYQIRSMMQSILGCCYELSHPLRPDPGPNSSSLPSLFWKIGRIWVSSTRFEFAFSGPIRNGPEEEEFDLMVYAPDLVKIIETSIHTFQLFLKMEVTCFLICFN
ncbi:hypothetical protein ACFX1X_020252 [Malus domestica]